jgi:ubiquinone/menaquinone biosynthesis C-methylase UbiE
VAAVAARVAPGGLAAGVDYDPGLIEAARCQRPAGTHRGPALTMADAAAIPCVDGAFDRVYTERMLQHCPAPQRVVAEMARVTKPGGLVVLADTDWGTLSVDAPVPAAERASSATP